MSFDDQLPPKTRLLRAAAELLANSDGSPVSTRQITKLAGVTAPTLYHHFGDKEGLFDAVVAAGFERLLAETIMRVVTRVMLARIPRRREDPR